MPSSRSARSLSLRPSSSSDIGKCEPPTRSSRIQEKLKELTLGVTKSWTDTKGEAKSAAVQCPSGSFKCGVMATPSICWIEGKVSYDFTDDYTLGCDKPGKNQDYHVESVCLLGNSGNEKMNAVVDVSYSPVFFHVSDTYKMYNIC